MGKPHNFFLHACCLLTSLPSCSEVVKNTAILVGIDRICVTLPTVPSLLPTRRAKGAVGQIMIVQLLPRLHR